MYTLTPTTSEHPVSLVLERVNGHALLRHASTGTIWFSISPNTGGSIRGKYCSLNILPPVARRDPYTWKVEAVAHGGAQLHRERDKIVSEYDTILKLADDIADLMGLRV